MDYFENPWTYQSRYFFTSLPTLPGLVTVAALLALFILSVSPRGRWVVIALLLYVSSLEVDFSHSETNVLIAPLTYLRSAEMPVVGLLLIFLLIPTFAAPEKGRTLWAGVIAFFVFQTVFAGRTILGGNVERGLLSFAVFALLFATVGLGVSRWLVDLESAHSFVRGLAGGGVIFAGCTVVQLVINPGAILNNGRLESTTGNPQHAAVLISLLLLPVFFVAMRRGEKAWRRAACAAAAGLMVLFLIWTGSRTGAAMSLMGLGCLLRFRVGRMVWAAAVPGAVILVALQFFSSGADNLWRLTSTLDTRTANWMIMVRDFMGSPLFGNMGGGSPGVTEGSYLSAAGRLGLVGLVPMLVSVGLAFAAILRVNRLRSLLGPEILLADLAIAGVMSAGIGGIFEGFLMATVSAPLICTYLYLGLLGFVVRYLTAARDQAGELHPLPVDMTQAEYAYEQGYNQAPAPALGSGARFAGNR